ncbi:LysM peptidoglycan-binding domain-containing protein [Pseudoalteromonas sp. SG45-5]|uniref:LysM peptidoglycan-binding domain-containing protein n=1 Tax=unclassified Pseudoalteromonas TaxID=194690 RepID=UPI0015FD4BE2|nr:MULTISPECIES: LysM peptidoglycan-binding domain-containing protein [unclassified Pseudoalteromonas]MBB1387597.1 LysM peptidoglycan-binding domain-containing protein [Pseudoalteromonas sp. SG45-5]MBB1395822.1 LysM peptidoglycan-binding domain-containing protein [Pseudoalteromonas sp. SG44-4]MBB1448862.1 LysM peptidoglycan-binding domain-containing protein [Pseudoalteromonas sp. SG41-6]
MNKPPLLVVLAFALSGCQTVTTLESDSQIASQANQQLGGASPNDINNALMVNAQYQQIDSEEQEAPVFDDVWERIRYQLSIDIPQNRPVVAERNYYARHQAYLDRISKRAEPYLHFIVEEVEKREMPIEIALLPIVESAFDPFGYSNRSASGIWQFMPATGERFDLKQNWWYDGRRDIVQSTRAALDYLSYLHKTLEGDWLNAIAAYNSGEGRLMRAIKKNRKKHLPTDFWSLDLPRETTAYVPKLLALADLLKRSDDFNVTWQPVINAQVVEVVDVGSQIDLALAADMADMTLTELYRLNPGFNRWATDPNGPHSLLLPVDKAEQFSQKLARTDIKDRLRWQQYTVARGDSLSVIAKKFTTSLSAIRSLNKLKSNTIKVGQQLLVPLTDGAINSEHLPKQMRLAANKNTRTKLTHKVKSGDTLWDISREYDVTMDELAKWNKLKKNSVLRLNQNLTVYKSINKPQSAIASTNRTITYKVRRGDSLARIASKFNLAVNDIIKWNNLAGQKYLQPGQKLKLKVDVRSS